MTESAIEQHQVFAGVIDTLEAIGIEYVIWGDVAAVAYGEPRFTYDMDIVVKLGEYRARLMAQALEKDHYYVSLPSILDAVSRGGYFNAIHFYSNVKVDFFVPRHDPIIEWAFEHRRMIPFDEVRRAAYMPPEAVILTKLRTYRDSGSTRHLDDIEGILRVSGPGPNRTYIEREATRMEMLKVWRELLAKTEAAWEDDVSPAG
jgi:hypothetical protein